MLLFSKNKVNVSFLPIVFICLASLLAGCEEKNAVSGPAIGKGLAKTCTPGSVASMDSIYSRKSLKAGGDPVCTVDRFHQPSEPITTKVDVLFVMDNSESMHRHWQLMAQSIGKLIHELPPGQDIRFSVLLGTIQKFTGVLFSAPGVPKVLDSKKLSEDEIVAALEKTFSEAVKYENVDWIGAGEALIYSTYYAVTRSAKANQRHGFFRPDAALNIIYMSDDADESYPYPTKQFWDLPAKCNWTHHEKMRQLYHVPRGIGVDSAFAAVKQLKGDMPVLTSAFVNITRADILVDNKLTDKCIFDSPGLGFFQMVEKTGGVLYSVHRDRGEGLAQCGRLLRARIGLLHDFALSKPAEMVDPSTIEADVDSGSVPHGYSPATNVVHLENAGKPGSLVEIHYCEPVVQHNWAITDFNVIANQTMASLTWNTTGYSTSGKVLYGTSPGSLNDVAMDPESVASHNVSISALAPDTVYYFQAVSSDQYGTEKKSDVISVRTKPAWAMAPLLGQASRNSASLSWETSAYPTFGRVVWGISPDQLVNTTPETAALKNHTLLIAGLAPDTLYYFQAISRDQFRLEQRGEVISKRTVADWSIVAFSGTASRFSADVQWQTPEYATTGRIFYGLAPNALTSSLSAPEAGKSHALSLGALAAGTTYYLQVVAQDDLGEVKQSSVISLSTIPDWTLAPLIAASTETTFTVNFETHGYPTTGKVLWGLAKDQLTNEVAAGSGDDHTATVTGLSPDTDYFAKALATDDLASVRSGEVVTIHTTPLPAWAITEAAGIATTTAAAIAWKTAEYPTTGTVVFGKSPESLAGSVSECSPAIAHSLNVTGLDPDTLYYFQVQAHDDKGQQQASSVIALRTQAIPLPSWELADFAGVPDLHTVALNWNTSAYATIGKIRWGTSSTNLDQESAAEGVAGLSHAIVVSGLAARTTYYFQAVSSDDRGQTKASSIVTVTTLAPAPTWQVTGFDGTSTSSSVSLIWQTTGTLTKGTVKVGLSAADLTLSSIDVPDFAASHIVGVTGLSPSTTYFFQVVAEDSDGGTVASNVIFKKTKAATGFLR